MHLIGNLKLRKKQAVLGLFAAWQLTVALVAFAPIFLPAPAEAQKPVTCFMRVECLDLNTKGNCDKEHCFEPRKECPDGQGLCYANPPAVPLVIAIGGKTQVVDLSDYIAIIFNFGAAAAGTVATVMFIVGGFQYLTAGGDSGRVSAGKKRIVDALVGLMLVLGSVLMLRTVNPDILKLQMPKIEIVKKKLFVGCDLFALKAKCGDPFVIMQIPGSNQSMPLDKQFKIGTADDVKQKKGIICRGMSCGMAGLDDGTFKCKKDPKSSEKPSETPSQCGGAPAAPYMCSPCAGWGGDCSKQGKSDECCTGFCGTRSTALSTKDIALSGGNVAAGALNTVGKGLCTNGETGVNCGGNGECRSGRCETRGFHTCSSGLTGAACDDSKQCAAGYACPGVTGLFICTPRVPGNYCLSNSDCGDGYVCPRDNCGAGTLAKNAVGAVSDAGAAAGQAAIAAARKAYDLAYKAMTDSSYTCLEGLRNGKKVSLLERASACSAQPGLISAFAVTRTALEAVKAQYAVVSTVAGGAANSAAKAIEEAINCGRCRPANNTQDCTDDASCAALGQGARCVTTDRDIKVCTTGEDGSPCMHTSDCTDGFCVAAVTSILPGGGDPGICSKGEIGERCSKNQECKNKHCYLDDGISATREFLKTIGSWGESKYGFCVTGEPGAGCNPNDGDAGCNSGYTCSKESHMCFVKKNSCGP